jgi:hypothetical protein
MKLHQRVDTRRDADLWVWCVNHLEGPIPTPNFDDNGCTCSPDYMLITGEALWPGCRVHDFAYSGEHGDPDLTRVEGDARFRRNLYKLIRYQQKQRERGWRGAMRKPANVARARYYSLIYWRAVRRLGARHYTPPAGRISVLT